MVNESLDEAFVADPARETAAPSSDGTSTTTASPAESAPSVITAGTFVGVGHSASGSATVYEQDGRYVLRFEDDTDIQNGPDLYVYVLAASEYDGTGPTDFVDLGKLKGNVGGQNYELPPEFDPTVNQVVLIWCLRFSVPFAAAPLA